MNMTGMNINMNEYDRAPNGGQHGPPPPAPRIFAHMRHDRGRAPRAGRGGGTGAGRRPGRAGTTAAWPPGRSNVRFTIAVTALVE